MPLKDSEAMATIAVKDIDAARAFYRDKLGLDLVSDTGTSSIGCVGAESADAISARCS